MKSKYAALMDAHREDQGPAEDDEKALAAAIKDFKKTGTY